VTENELRSRLAADPVPGEPEAGERAWPVVRAAYGSYERKPWLERHSRVVLALAAAAALGVAAVTPPGRALVDRVREAVGVEPTQPALVRVPSPGRILVESAQGPWVVQQDGSKRRLGAYEGASWSPRGLFVVATQGRKVVALEPNKTDETRWTVTRRGRVSDARWAPSGFRIAYREGNLLRVVVGDGTDDRLFARRVAPVAPAWLPDATRNVVAYADARGRIRVVDVDTRAELWSTRSPAAVAELDWSSDGSRLLALASNGRAWVYDARGRELRELGGVTRAAYSPAGNTLAYATYHSQSESSSVVILDDGSSRTIFTGSGPFQDVVWSPNGRWLLVSWPAADQWLFLKMPSGRGLHSVPNLSSEFDPGGNGAGDFPTVSGWAPPASG
jgi:hypothetical protein